MKTGLLAVVSASLAAQVTGTVVGPQGAPVQDVLVAAYDHRLNVVTTTTDEEGAFALTTPGGNRVRLHAIPPDDSGLAEELSSANGPCAALEHTVMARCLRGLYATLRQSRGDYCRQQVVTDGVVTAVPILPTDLPLVAASTDQAGDFC